jgi:hypothetical protein
MHTKTGLAIDASPVFYRISVFIQLIITADYKHKR